MHYPSNWQKTASPSHNLRSDASSQKTVWCWLSKISDSPSPAAFEPVSDPPSPCPPVHGDWIERKITNAKRAYSCDREYPAPKRLRRPLMPVEGNMTRGTQDNYYAVRTQMATTPTKAEEMLIDVQGCLTPGSNTPTMDSGNQTSTGSNTSARKAKPIVNELNIGRLLDSHGMKQNSDAIDKYPKFEAKVRGILGAQRDSAMKASSAKLIAKTRDAYARQNEATFAANIIPPIIKTSRTINMTAFSHISPEPKRATLQTQNDSVNKSPIPDRTLAGPTGAFDQCKGICKELHRTFFDDGILMCLNRDFTRTLLPYRRDQNTEKALAQALEKTPGMTNPRPDYAYGFTPEKLHFPFSTAAFSEISALLDVVNGMLFTFFIIEVKGSAGNIAEAENQACRSGATLINAHRQLVARTRLLREKEPPGPDEDTFVFSCSLGPLTMDIWLHWAEVGEHETLFHMNRLGAHHLADPDQLSLLRQKLHNIFDWASLSRLPALELIMPKLVESERELHEMQRQKSQSPKKRSAPAPPTPKSASSNPHSSKRPRVATVDESGEPKFG